MPLYLFSILAAPKWVINSIKTLQCTFLWKGDKVSHNFSLVKWEIVWITKEEGGLGLQDPAKNNETLSTKIWWNWITKNSSPWAHLWNKKYVSHLHTQNLISYS